ncbi:MAG: 1-aminocyclopropane-1-carboxylate deaminase/D-cysteine desulfhydrase [Sandaracinaceae bacterium]
MRHIPHVSLARLPTPVEPLEAVSRHVGASIWIKRDDQTAERYGGNKVRKLEYALGEALKRRADAVITTGAAGSHHALATALFGAELGLSVHAVLVPAHFTPHAEDNLRALLVAGSEVHPVRSSVAVVPKMATLAAKARLRGGHRPVLLPPGGTNTAGVIGHVEAGLELARQMESREVPEPDAVFVPLGTGGTAAGLAIGLAAAGLTTQVIGVRVVPRAVANRPLLGRLIRGVVKHLRSIDNRFPDVAEDAMRHLTIEQGELGDGYGVPTSQARVAKRMMAEHAGLELDTTYTAKTVAAMTRLARREMAGKTLLYVHTLSGALLDPRVRRAPVLPKNVRRLLLR